MNDVVIMDGETYISSKRASEISGYSQDYVGYLARRDDIVARQIGGLWHISERSLREYKKKAEEYSPTPPSAGSRKPDPETIVSFDGKEYISVARGAQLTGYHQDYVGQLARGARILSRQIGKRWYIERGALLKHRQEKDKLLAAVQAASVGLQRSQIHNSSDPTDDAGPQMIYTRDSGDLLPIPDVARDHARNVESRYAEMPISSHVSDIRASGTHATATPTNRTGDHPISGRRGMRARIATAATVVATIVIVVTIGYVSIQRGAVFSESAPYGDGYALVNQAAEGLSRVLDVIEDMLTHELRYTRSR